MLSIPPTELAAVGLLISHSVEFVLIGGHAVTFHGGIRGTSDVDVFVSTSEVNAARLLAAITEIIGHQPAFTAAQLAQPGSTFHSRMMA
jgi:hypothetical protein